MARKLSRALEEFCLEQLAGVFAGPVAATGLAAGGSVAGRAWHPEGQSGGADEGGEFKAIRRGWCLGEETFRQELLAQLSERLGPEHYGEERAETEEAKGERIIAGELKRRKWKATELQNRPKGDAEKVPLAARLRAETTMTTAWIAERLGMGSRGYLNHLLYRRRKSRQGVAIIEN